MKTTLAAVLGLAASLSAPAADDPGEFGHDALLADLALGPGGEGKFLFPAGSPQNTTENNEL